ncbi:hypothetical protein PFISCL1PPCAC_23348, partial [Pristionchus fissidentatus]
EIMESNENNNSDVEPKLEALENEIEELSMNLSRDSDSFQKLVKDKKSEKKKKKKEDKNKKKSADVPNRPSFLVTDYIHEQALGKPMGVDDEKWENCKMMANIISEYVLNVAGLYASGEYSKLSKEESQKIVVMVKGVGVDDNTMQLQKKLCEHVLIEKMKERNETDEIRTSGLPTVRSVLHLLTTLPREWVKNDLYTEEQQEEHSADLCITQITREIRPAEEFAHNFIEKYACLISPNNEWLDCPIDGRKRFAVTLRNLSESAAFGVKNSKGDVGLQAMMELHEHLENAETYCYFCEILTGGREEFYAHLVSPYHMNSIAQEIARFEMFTLVVNVYRKDLV